MSDASNWGSLSAPFANASAPRRTTASHPQATLGCGVGEELKSFAPTKWGDFRLPSSTFGLMARSHSLSTLVFILGSGGRPPYDLPVDGLSRSQ